MNKQARQIRAAHFACTTSRIAEIPPPSALVARAWRLANGATEVELIDPTNAGWQAYCEELSSKNQALADRIVAARDALKDRS